MTVLPLEIAARLLGMFKWVRPARLEELMPSVLFDNEARLGDLGLDLTDIGEQQRRRRSRGR